MLLWNRQWTRKQLMDRIGSLSQLGGITRLEYADGKAKGVGVIRVRTAAGFEFSILPDKGMDILEASYLGRSLSWHAPNGIVHPAYYDSRDIQWLKTFPGGLLATCGMNTAGAPGEDEGQQLGLHGAVGNIPAENVTWEERWEDDDCRFTVAGSMRETWVHGPNLLLRRTISSSLASRGLRFHDCVENQGFKESPLMHLYHLNFGFPMLTETSRIYAPSIQQESRDEFSESSADRWMEFESPNVGIAERVYFHTMKPDQQGNVTVVLVSEDDKKDLGVSIRYCAACCPCFVEWKMTGVNHFALGLEPANCRVGGRKAEREAGRLRVLRPGEKQEFVVELTVLDGQRDVADAIAATKR